MSKSSPENCCSTEPKKLGEIFLRISPSQFHTLKFILEGYDNLAILSSVDKRVGVVRLRYSPRMAKEFFALLESISELLK